MTKQGSGGNVLAALCSFFIPGLGQLLQARVGMAFIQFFLAIVLWVVFMGWIIHLWSVIDAAKFDPESFSKETIKMCPYCKTKNRVEDYQCMSCGKTIL